MRISDWSSDVCSSDLYRRCTPTTAWRWSCAARATSTRPSRASSERAGSSEAGGGEVAVGGGDGGDEAMGLGQDLLAVEAGGHDLVLEQRLVGVAHILQRGGGGERLAGHHPTAGPAAEEQPVRRSEERRVGDRGVKNC